MEPLARLEWFCRALAQSSETQMTLFPPFEDVIDELILGFEEAYSSTINMSNTLKVEEKEAFYKISEMFSHIKDDCNKGALSNDALENSDFWSKIRLLAVNALTIINWSTSSPNIEDNFVVYIDSETGRELDI